MGRRGRAGGRGNRAAPLGRTARRGRVQVHAGRAADRHCGRHGRGRHAFAASGRWRRLAVRAVTLPTGSPATRRPGA